MIPVLTGIQVVAIAICGIGVSAMFSAALVMILARNIVRCDGFIAVAIISGIVAGILAS